MGAKEYLQQAYKLNELIEHDLKELEELKRLALSVLPVDTSRICVQGGIEEHDRIGSIIAKIDEYSRKINSEIDSYVDLKAEIHSKIMLVQNNDLRLVLFYRYIEFMKWEAIAVKMDRTFQWIHVLHKCALQTFEKILDS